MLQCPSKLYRTSPSTATVARSVALKSLEQWTEVRYCCKGVVAQVST
jgi:hypothetical protein